MNHKRVSSEQVAPTPASSATDGDRRFSRATLLRFGGVAAAGGAVSVLLRANPAGATTGAIQFGLQNDAGADSTGLTSSNDTDTLHVTNSADAIAVQVRSGGAAVVAIGTTGGGVVGVSRGTGPGMWGKADIATGPAVKAQIDNPAATAAAIEAAQNGTGIGLLSHLDNPVNANRAVHGLTNGLGQAILGQITSTANKSAAIRGQTTGSGSGIEGASSLGVGGRFAGKTAQIQLIPSGASSHPSSGTAGQLFVDRSNRLWFCKGGTSWHQLA